MHTKTDIRQRRWMIRFAPWSNRVRATAPPNKSHSAYLNVFQLSLRQLDCPIGSLGAGMRRREFIAFLGGVTAIWPRLAIAQQASGKVWRVAWLSPVFADTAVDREIIEAFREEMQELGYVEGNNLVLDSRFAEGHIERLASLTSELIALRPDVIVAYATPAIAAAQRATSTIPIVMAPATDPIGSGFIQSLAHPGANITGVANMYGDAIGKSIELLHAILPAARRIAVLMSANPAHPQQYALVEAAAKALGLTPIAIMAATPADLQQAFKEMRQQNCAALFVLADPIRPTIPALATESKIPAIYQYGGYVDLGGLASYGAALTPMYRKAAQYVDKIFKGGNPAEIPVEQPVAFELALNLKTAAALGLSLPDIVLARADKVIE
jgi:putative ABC transport system substrate-binding protein